MNVWPVPSSGFPHSESLVVGLMVCWLSSEYSVIFEQGPYISMCIRLWELCNWSYVAMFIVYFSFATPLFSPSAVEYVIEAVVQEPRKFTRKVTVKKNFYGCISHSDEYHQKRWFNQFLLSILSNILGFRGSVQLSLVWHPAPDMTPRTLTPQS